MSAAPSGRLQRVVISLCFFADGMLLGSWASRVPAVQDHAGLTNPQLGVALFASALGALVAMPIAGRLCDRIGSRAVLVVALLGTCTALLLTSFATGLPTLAAALFAFGAGFGSTNVSVNAQGLALERTRTRRILSSFHAAFSAGGLAGAGLGGLVAAAAIGPQVHFAVVCVVLAGTTVALTPTLLPEKGVDAGSRPTLRIGRALLLIGMAAFCCMLAEGAAVDWSAVYLSRSAGASAAVAALGYTAFSLAMTASRLAGDRISERLDPATLVGAGGALAAAGLGGALALGSVAAGIVGFVAMGAGLGVVIPVLFRAAGTSAGVSAGVGVATASTIGWLGFLAGPAAIGFVAGAVGLRTALGIVVAMTLLLAVLGRGIRSDGHDVEARLPELSLDRAAA
jgi:MFS family permease